MAIISALDSADVSAPDHRMGVLKRHARPSITLSGGGSDQPRGGRRQVDAARGQPHSRAASGERHGGARIASGGQETRFRGHPEPLAKATRIAWCTSLATASVREAHRHLAPHLALRPCASGRPKTRAGLDGWCRCGSYILRVRQLLDRIEPRWLLPEAHCLAWQRDSGKGLKPACAQSR